MKISESLIKTQKHTAKDETSRNAQLLTQGGFIYKNMAGVYSYTPIGLRVLNKIMGIIREEMDRIGAQELFLASLQDPQIWEKTERWSDEAIDVWFKTRLKNETEIGLATTHEEPLTEMLSHFIGSYKDLPRYLYQFQTKFRNELRAKSGLMRSREFIMKDLYSFSRSEAELQEFYDQVILAYSTIFQRLGLGEKTIITYASGGSFSDFSHEFQTLTEAGEDTIYLDEEKGLAINKEVYSDEVITKLGLNKSRLVERKSVEVGNIFKLGTRFSETLGLGFTDEDGRKKPVVMGSYGIGPGRVMGTIAELHNDDQGLIWPEAVTPFQVYLIGLDTGSIEAEKIYRQLLESGVEVLFDDRDSASPGEKFADADLLGIPYRVVVSPKTIKENSIELKSRQSSETELIKFSELLERI
ncbi:MAG: prolyl-tRNA synthetase [Candidatus Yanofskybacteria bacterium CG10_big_fil_rev_8_21_14_0_10_46_23]|uniref:Proline--tRNA ligase n=1 Tax=Candidatus Yanofskybacteria bacterium CG10_big_fil_rev_8_21_14_0_10_46_23 TaxID=1975098 RepID=A0A2H0R522_9BACT|nr:MAG: prolyl-tRNA synthetase [Candidatus Yanofskybacteria bacterium CG10_big_fil_rev_8_21_14_0_10_46_23]